MASASAQRGARTPHVRAARGVAVVAHARSAARPALRRRNVCRPSASPDGIEPAVSLPPPAAVPPPPAAAPEDSAADRAFTAAKTMSQLWAIMLPLGYGAVPLAARALADVPGGPAFAIAGGEALALALVLALLRSKGVALPFDLRDARALALGAAAGAAALGANQLLFGAADGGGGGGAAGAAAAAAGGGPAAAAALFAAAALLAPAAEELAYRGFLLPALRAAGAPAPAAVALSALAFAAAHLEPAGAPQLTVVGLALGGAAAAAGGNLAAPLVGHALYNGALAAAALLGGD
jgi:membrane protease YdiL (CAAX protease family)